MPVVEVEQAHKSARDLYNRGVDALERQNLEFAIELLGSALEYEPHFLDARKKLRVAQVAWCNENRVNHKMSSVKGTFMVGGVKSAIKKNDGLKAVAAAEKLLRIDALNPDFGKLFGEAAEVAGMPEAAVHTLELIRKDNPENKDFLQSYAELLNRIGYSLEEQIVWEQLQDLDPKNQIYSQRARAASAAATVTKHDWDKAGTVHEKTKNREETEMLEQQNKVQMGDADLANLIAETQEKIQREPQNLNYRRGLADLYLKGQQFEEALEVLNAANDMAGGADPQIDSMISKTTINIYDYNIQVLVEEGDEAGAERERVEKAVFQLEDAEEKVRRYPNDLKFKFDYGVMLLENGKIDEAIPHFQASSRSPDRRSESLYNLGACFNEKGLKDMAVDQLQTAVTEIPVMNDAKKEIIYMLGQIHEDMGKKAEALNFFKEIYAVDFGYRDVQKKVEGGYGQDDGEA